MSDDKTTTDALRQSLEKAVHEQFQGLINEAHELLLATSDEDLVWHVERIDPAHAISALNGGNAIGVCYPDGRVEAQWGSDDESRVMFASTDDWLTTLNEPESPK